MSCRRVAYPIRMLVFRGKLWSQKKTRVFETYPNILAGNLKNDKNIDKSVNQFVSSLQDIEDSKSYTPEKVDPSSLLVIDRDPVFLRQMSDMYYVSTMQICSFSEWPEMIGERMYKAQSIAYIPHAVDHMQ